MLNYVSSGDTVTVTTPSGGVTSGLPVQIGQLLGVAANTQTVGLPVEILTRGTFKVTKVGTQAWTEGQIVYWDKENSRFTSVAAASLLAGVAVLGLATAMPGAGAGETTGYVRLNGAMKPDEP